MKEECYNLDHSFLIWLNSRLKQYKEDASKIVDLEYHKFEYKSVEYTQLQIIDRLIYLSGEIEKGFYDFNLDNVKEVNEMKDEMFDLFKLVFWQMWW